MPKVNKNPLQKKLINAVTNAKLSETENLLKKGANPNQSISNSTLLHSATRNGSFQIVALLLQYGAKESINKQDNHGCTPLHETVITNKNIPNNEAIAKLLLQYGASMFIVDNLSQTPLKLAMHNHPPIWILFLEKIKEMLRTAVLENDIATTSFLLRTGINPNQEDSTTGCTLLHFAAQYGFLQIANLLLQHGTDVNKTNKIGFTALHYSADNNHKKIAELLLQNGAFMFIKDKHGKSPGNLAASKSYLELAALLHPNIQANKNISIFFPRAPKPSPLTVEIDPFYDDTGKERSLQSRSPR